MKLPDFKFTDPIIKAALNEDIGAGDVTVASMRIDGPAEAEIVCKEQGFASGIPVAARVFELLDPEIEVKTFKSDGEAIGPGDVLLHIRGRGASILSAERSALNFMGRMSGIATMAARYVAAVEGTGCRIYDTRKTAPNLRVLDKYAVTCGGASNHRRGLDDMILIKENHIRWVAGIDKALDTAVSYAKEHGLKIEIEVTNLDEYRRALAYPVDMIMLDHFTTQQLREATAIDHRDILLEASGNITLDNVAEIAACGVNVISIGALTHSVKCLDLSLLFYV